MRLTWRCEYALLALVALARRRDAGYVSAESIAELQGIPRRFLEQIFTNLRRAGFVQSLKGQHGGYRLARPPEEISLAEVVRRVDGALAPTESVSKYFYHPTPIEREAGLVRVFEGVRKAVAKMLEDTTLADVCGKTHGRPRP